MASVFPDAAACLENVPGEREIPDHPLVKQTVRDCLEEAMDYDALARVLASIHQGGLTLVSRDTPEPSPLAHEILNARPYAFLDDAPLEERRAHAVYTRRASEPSSAADLGALDPDAIDRVRDEARPDPRDADELHDALLTAACLTDEEAERIAPDLFRQLVAAARATRLHVPNHEAEASLWIAAERLPEAAAVHPQLAIESQVQPPASRAARIWTRDEALVEVVRGRLTIVGPTTAEAMARSVAVPEMDVHQALLALEAEGVVLRGTFDTRIASRLDAGAPPAPVQWCDRRLLARIHRYTLNRLRAEIEPVAPADYMRFLFTWQHVDGPARLSGLDGLRAVIAGLDGFELAAAAWERSVLPARLEHYEPALLDTLCLTGEVGWARLSRPTTGADVVGATPIALLLREHEAAWFAGRSDAGEPVDNRTGGAGNGAGLNDRALAVLETLRSRGALFLHEIAAATGLADAELRRAIADLVAAGVVTSDGFAGLRAIIGTSARTHGAAGRWSVVAAGARVDHEAAVELQARALLRRYGIVFRRVLTREVNAAPWRELTRVYRRLEARGEIRGGRFVAGISGEQFALPDAIERLRELRRTPPAGRLVTISTADPLNLAGVVTAGERLRAAASNRLVCRDGVPLAVLEGEYMRPLAEIATSIAADVASALTGRPMPPVLSGYVG
jgi:ATP-dependent Lhr-like helicase